MANLMKRIPEFMAVAQRVVTKPVWMQLNPNQQAALTSVAYNTGSVRLRVFPEDPKKTASEIANLHTHIPLPKRRKAEAALYLQPIGPQPQVPVVVGGLCSVLISIQGWLHANPQLALGGVALAICAGLAILYLLRDKSSAIPVTAVARLRQHMQQLAALQSLVVEDRLEVQRQRDELDQAIKGIEPQE